METPVSLKAFKVGMLESALVIFQRDTSNRKDRDLKFNLLLKIAAKANVRMMVIAAPIRQNMRGRGGVNGSI